MGREAPVTSSTKRRRRPEQHTASPAEHAGPLEGEIQVVWINPSRLSLHGPRTTLSAWRQRHRRWVEGAEYTRPYQEGRWDGYWYPGNWSGNGGLDIPRGWLVQLAHDVRRVQIPQEPHALPLPAHAADTSLYPWQNEALQAIAMQRWGRIALATNSGKGAVIARASAMCADALQAPALILCDEVAVFDALREQVAAWSPHIPLHTIAAGHAGSLPASGVVLAMVPTLSRRLKGELTSAVWMRWCDTIRAVFCDEADRATAASWQHVLQCLTRTTVRVGFSGTFPADATHGHAVLEGSLGPILLRVRNSHLIAHHVSARPVVELYPYTATLSPELLRGLRTLTRGPELRAALYAATVEQNPVRHRFIAQLLLPDVPNAIIVHSLVHGRALASLLPHAAFLCGEDPPDIRQAVLADFLEGKVQNLVTSRILDRGTNALGHTKALIFAASQGSMRQILQRIGRGLRRGGGKEFLRIRDIMDRGHKYLDAASASRLRVYDTEGFDLRICDGPIQHTMGM